ncbi:Flp pilus assembly complex ATPase component TadA [Halarchaeum sp. CBA1220]|uniref:ATPase, T2SS/T4P/T4SS family n=1 Tax=Halarchaeum sp. CBA1220 TaxID=1853682 RepID=UPI000F3A9915|nr:ATPase, T2SS/T4P/T4SS family [Halarchaeum sp. CBA1220]QLC34462.1 Flp pilus assembly complex ATPase component TadA [Halarchaeum sp. CBA1220]
MSTDQADDAAGDAEQPADPEGVDGASSATPEADAPESEPEEPGPAVVKGEYTWEDFKDEYYYDEEGEPPTDDEENVVPFDPEEYLGFDPDDLPGFLSRGGEIADTGDDVVEERTLDLSYEDEDEFFSDVHGTTTMANRYDLEKEVALEKKSHFAEVERYWVNKPYAFVVIFHSDKENEMKYYLVEPYQNQLEDDLQEFLTGKLRTAIKYASDDVAAEGSERERRDVIERETRELLERYDIYSGDVRGEVSFVDRLREAVEQFTGEGEDAGEAGASEESTTDRLDGIAARPEPAVLEEDAQTLTQYQVEKLLYYLKRDFIGYERIDGIKHDVNVEDISCDGYESPVFAYHSDYEQLITNVYHGTQSLDDFVVKLAQRSGKGISKRQPQVDATLPDGSRAQLTLGREVSDHGTNYTIRQFKDVPFTPVDLINWKTFSLEEMAYLWLCIENNKSLIFAGGTASGKTTSLNAVSLFIPSNAKIVSIEDTREVELPQRNWVASVTRPSFGEDEKGDIDEFDLLEAALRQRPDYIVMGEVRGEEGRTLFQVMSTGHTTYTTFHADNVSEVLKRFTTAPINVSKTLFTALDLVSIQSSTRVQGKKVRRNRSITEINRYDAENDEINVSDVFQWEPEGDEFRQLTESNTLDEIQFDRGWSRETLQRELFERRVVLAYLIRNGLNEYTQVAATLQAYIADPDTILTLMANDALEESLADLRGMESVLIDVDPEKEAMVPRPDPTEDVYEEAIDLLQRAEDDLFEEYRGEEAPDISFALTAAAQEAADADVVVDESGETPTIEDVYAEATEGAGEEAPDETGEETDEETAATEGAGEEGSAETDAGEAEDASTGATTEDATGGTEDEEPTGGTGEDADTGTGDEGAE